MSGLERMAEAHTRGACAAVAAGRHLVSHYGGQFCVSAREVCQRSDFAPCCRLSLSSACQIALISISFICVQCNVNGTESSKPSSSVSASADRNQLAWRDLF